MQTSIRCEDDDCEFDGDKVDLSFKPKVGDTLKICGQEYVVTAVNVNLNRVHSSKLVPSWSLFETAEVWVAKR